MPLVLTKTFDSGVVECTLNDPNRRNALGLEMFDAIEQSLKQIGGDVGCLLLRGQGPVFCAGFDMKACEQDVSILDTYILKLSLLIRRLRRLHCPVVVAAQGGAIAGGCAILTGCDLIVGERHGKYGYPVHQLGISPAVTIPTLFQRIGQGRTRSLLMSGELIDGEKAMHLGLITHLCDTLDDVGTCANSLAHDLATKPPIAMQATKKWLNGLDGSRADEAFKQILCDSYASIEAQERLRSLWN